MGRRYSRGDLRWWNIYTYIKEIVRQQYVQWKLLPLLVVLLLQQGQHDGNNWSVVETFSYSESQCPWECVGTGKRWQNLQHGMMMVRWCACVWWWCQDRHFSYRSNFTSKAWESEKFAQARVKVHTSFHMLMLPKRASLSNTPSIFVYNIYIILILF